MKSSGGFVTAFTTSVVSIAMAGCTYLPSARHAAITTAPAGAPLSPGTKFRDCAHCPEMLVIPAGVFTMGAPPSEPGSFDRDRPQHPVTFPQAFAVGVYDVTRSEYSAFVSETGRADGNGCHFFDGKRWALDSKKNWRHPGFPQSDHDPVVCVSWNDAQAYARWLSGKVRVSNCSARDSSAGPYRLLSEAEWEYVARAGTGTPYYWGEHASHDYANYGLEQCYPCGIAKEGKDRWYYTSPVGAFAPNAFGLYDMSGNVWQWTEDCMHSSLDDGPTDGSAWTSGECHDRVLRGGSWLDNSQILRLAVRNPWPPDDRNNANGFRVARALRRG